MSDLYQCMAFQDEQQILSSLFLCLQFSFARIKAQTCPSGSGEIHNVIAAIAESKKLGS